MKPDTLWMDFEHHDLNRHGPPGWRVDLLRAMLRIRTFEQYSLNRYNSGRMGGWLPLSIGQESIAASVRSVMTKDDHSISGFRGLGHAVAAGVDRNAMMAELFGKRRGTSKGKAGVFSFFDPGRHHWGAHGLVATQTALAAGLAFALKQREVPGAAVCFLGDGAVNQGVFHETLNLSALFGLPVVFVIENNGYAMGMSEARSSRFTGCLARRAEGYDMAWDHFTDGDPREIRVRMAAALERARLEQRPTLVEIETYRYYGFTVADANAKRYRTPAEIDARKAQDPLDRWKQGLVSEGWVTEADAEAMREDAKAEARAAVKFADECDPPEIADITRDVYWESDHQTPASLVGRHFF